MTAVLTIIKMILYSYFDKNEHTTKTSNRTMQKQHPTKPSLDLGQLFQMFQDASDREDKLIKKAIDASYEMMTVDKFRQTIRCSLNDILPFHLMWNSFHHDIPIYITPDFVKVFGYSGDLKKQRDSMIRLIKKYNISMIQFKNSEYAEFCGTLQGTINQFASFYPAIDTTSRGKCNSIHTLIMPKDLKKLWLVVNTENGNLVREYMVQLEELFHLYSKYQSEYKSNQLFIKDSRIDELLVETREINRRNNILLEEIKEIHEDLEVNQEVLNEINAKFDVVVEERAPKTQCIGKHDLFMIVKTNDEKTEWTHYAIRVQQSSIKRTLKKIKVTYPKFAQLVTIDYQPNGTNFFNLMKEHLVGKIQVSHNKIRLLDDYTEECFIKDIKRLDQSKRDVLIEDA
jgi:hypothetical protein